MRHRVAYRKLGRVTEHRIAMLRNQASALLQYERIETTVPRAKELRPFVERIITIAKRSLNAPEGSAHNVTARRAVARDTLAASAASDRVMDGRSLPKQLSTASPLASVAMNSLSSGRDDVVSRVSMRPAGERAIDSAQAPSKMCA